MLASLISPNLHVTIIHYPIALATLGLAIELFSIFWRRSSFRTAGRWMILLGTLLSIPAVTSGVYAAWQAQGGGPGMNWQEIKSQAPFDENQWELLRDHILLNSIGTGVMVIVVIVWLASSDLWRRRLHAVHLLALLLGVAALGFGAHHGGDMRFAGIGTVHNPPDALAVRQEEDALTWEQRIEAAVPVLEIHTLLAGMTIALSLAAVGLSLRRVGQSHPMEETFDSDIADALVARSHGQSDVSMLQQQTPISAECPSIPAARFWLLASLLALLTAAAGWWTFGTLNYQLMLDYARDPEHRRVMFHVIFGSGLIVLPLLLALFTRFAPRARFFLWILILALIVLIAMQVWMGVLLLFDTNSGPIQGFKAAP